MFINIPVFRLKSIRYNRGKKSERERERERRRKRKRKRKIKKGESERERNCKRLLDVESITKEYVPGLTYDHACVLSPSPSLVVRKNKSPYTKLR
jgi:hypothetical protein